MEPVSISIVAVSGSITAFLTGKTAFREWRKRKRQKAERKEEDELDQALERYPENIRQEYNRLFLVGGSPLMREDGESICPCPCPCPAVAIGIIEN
jgi:hypothetical protein